MKTPIWIKTALMLATLSMLSGCLGWPYEWGGGRGTGSISGGRGGGVFHGEQRGGSGERGGDEGGRR